jgi:predicted NAD-dependent protein-ADP-ribosyltransferase YbiA (DUF1768 family)
MQPENEQDPIFFFGETNPEYQFLSNFYEAVFKIDGKTYPTNEHFFQSQKFIGTPS